jgi:hypothetical protein
MKEKEMDKCGGLSLDLQEGDDSGATALLDAVLPVPSRSKRKLRRRLDMTTQASGASRGAKAAWSGLRNTAC